VIISLCNHLLLLLCWFVCLMFNVTSSLFRLLVFIMSLAFYCHSILCSICDQIAFLESCYGKYEVELEFPHNGKSVDGVWLGTAYCDPSPCGEGTVVLIVSCRCAYCCPESIHGKIIWHLSSYFVVAIYVKNCELSYNVLGMMENCNHTEWIYYRYYRTGCGIWLVGGKGTNVIMNNW